MNQTSSGWIMRPLLKKQPIHFIEKSPGRIYFDLVTSSALWKLLFSLKWLLQATDGDHFLSCHWRLAIHESELKHVFFVQAFSQNGSTPIPISKCDSRYTV